MNADDFRRLALGFESAIESAHMNHPDFRFGGKIFASLGVPDEGWGMVKLTPEQQRAFMKDAPTVFRPCNGAWGRQGCTNVHLEAASAKLVRAALAMAIQNLAAAPKKKTPRAGRKP